MNENKNYFPNCDGSVWLRSCKNEIIQPLKGKVSGTIPLWLNGTLVRNGPGLIEIGECTVNHLFDGLALLHRFAIENGNVTYQCKFLQSNTYKAAAKSNRIVVTGFGTKSVPDPCQTIFSRIASTFKWQEESDNAMISVYPFGDELYSFTENPIMYKINEKTLETGQMINMKKMMGIVSHSSHPHVSSSGTVYNLGLCKSALGLQHTIVCFPSKPQNHKNDYSMFDKAHIVAGVPARWPLHPCYMHTFGITKNYFIIVEQPLSLVVTKLILNKLINEPLRPALQWYKNQMTQINVVSRKSGKIAYTFFAEPFFYLHIINQYEHANHIFLDICSYKDPSMIDCMYIDAIKNLQSNPDYASMFRSQPIRFVLPLIDSYANIQMTDNLVKLPNTNAQAFLQRKQGILVIPEKLCDLGCETPTIHYEKYSGRKYHYFYAISADVDAANPGTIIKVDTVTKTTKTWCEDNCYPSEPIFIPTPSAQSEDDGIVLAAMVWGSTDTNHVGLIVLNAKTFQEMGRAEFHTGSPVPKCLHGWFLANKK